MLTGATAAAVEVKGLTTDVTLSDSQYPVPPLTTSPYKSMKQQWYFAYGSNMNPARMAERGMRMLSAEPARLAGWQLAFNKRAHDKPGIAYANVVASDAAQVPGVLYGVRSMADIERMDPFEGWPERYRREQMTVSVACGREQTCWVYVANPHWQQDGLLPERGYLNHLLSGRPWLPEAHYRWLLTVPCC